MFTGPSKDGIGNLGEYVEGVGYLVRRNAYQRWFGERMENEPENLKRLDLKWRNTSLVATWDLEEEMRAYENPKVEKLEYIGESEVG